MDDVKALDVAEYSSDMLFGLAEFAAANGLTEISAEIRNAAFTALIKSEELKAQAMGEQFVLAVGFR